MIMFQTLLPFILTHFHDYIRGDPCNYDECFLRISPKLVEIQSSKIIKKIKKQNSMAFYLIPGMWFSSFLTTLQNVKVVHFLEINVSA